MDGPRILEVVHIVARATCNTRERIPKNRSFADNFRTFVFYSITKHDMKLKLVPICWEMHSLYSYGVTESPKCVFFLLFTLTFDISSI